MSSVKKVSFRRAILPASIIAAMAFSGSASAFKVETDNPDLDVRFDNTFRYNAGWRMQAPTYYQSAVDGTSFTPSSNKWKSGDMITNRLDVLSELDFIYKKDTGFRLSAASWYDNAYDHHPNNNGPLNFFYGGNNYPAEIKRYYNGPSAEWLDAFVFTKLDLGDVPVNMKLGQHTIYWGETLFSLSDGIAAGQSYADLRKALATPGVEAKEVFKPLNQFSFSAQISPEFTVMGQYFFDWKADLIPLGGSYFSPADFITYSGGTNVGPAGALPGTAGAVGWSGTNQRPSDRRGDWGIAAKWRPEWLDGTAGFYYREYTPKDGIALAIDTKGGALFTDPTSVASAGVTSDPAAPRTKLTGLSLAKQIWGISWGMDLTYRKDAELQAITFLPYNAGAILSPSLAGTQGWMPIGDVYTAVVNMIAYDGKRDLFGVPFYDSAVFIAELSYDAVDKVTKNKENWNSCQNYNSSPLVASGAFNGTGIHANGGCITGAAYGISLKFEPKWFQVLPGTDLTMPIFLTEGLKGNSPVPILGTMEHAGIYSIGLAADVDAKYNFAINYNGNIYKHVTSINPLAPPAAIALHAHDANAALGDFSHHDWLSFTAKATW